MSTRLNSILDVEASHLALSKTENVSDRLVFKTVRLPLGRFAFEIADGLPDLCDDRAIRSSMKAHRLDVRTNHGPLACPVLAYGLAWRTRCVRKLKSRWSNQIGRQARGISSSLGVAADPTERAD